jgi:hypothetical protein
MKTPNIRYYARLEAVTSGKTPKYTIVAKAGYYPPMEELIGRDGKISMYLQEKLKNGNSVPAMRLQAKNSLNFTGLKDWFIDGKLSGYAYGYPSDEKTYAKGKKNPFYDYKNDGYLFIAHQTEEALPRAIELIVLEDAKILISAYCKQLIMGGFNEELNLLRRQSNSFI